MMGNTDAVFIIGDMNSRVGVKMIFILRDQLNEFLDDDMYIPDTPLLRVSLDTRCSSHGIKLLDVCKSTCLRIINGRLGRDHNIGENTFVSNQGASVINY